MKKQEFLNELEKKISGLPKDDIKERLEFYSEMIDDRMEDGLSEEDAVAQIGTVDDVVSDIASETPLFKLVKEKAKPKRKIKGWEILLLILGFPLWFPLVVTGLVLLFVGYVLIWVLVIVSYAVELSLIAGAFTGIVMTIITHFNLFYIASTLVLFGAAILFFPVCKLVTIATAKLTKKIALSIKKKFVRG